MTIRHWAARLEALVVGNTVQLVLPATKALQVMPETLELMVLAGPVVLQERPVIRVLQAIQETQELMVLAGPVVLPVLLVIQEMLVPAVLKAAVVEEVAALQLQLI